MFMYKSLVHFYSTLLIHFFNIVGPYLFLHWSQLQWFNSIVIIHYVDDQLTNHYMVHQALVYVNMCIMLQVIFKVRSMIPYEYWPEHTCINFSVFFIGFEHNPMDSNNKNANLIQNIFFQVSDSVIFMIHQCLRLSLGHGGLQIELLMILIPSCTNLILIPATILYRRS